MGNLRKATRTRHLSSFVFSLTDLVSLLNSGIRHSHPPRQPSWAFAGAREHGKTSELFLGSLKGRREGSCYNSGTHKISTTHLGRPLTCPAHQEGFGWLYTANTTWWFVRGLSQSPAPFPNESTNNKIAPPPLNTLLGRVRKCQR